MTIHIDSWVMAGIAIGFMVPAFLTSVAIGIGAFILMERAVRRSIIHLKRNSRARA